MTQHINTPKQFTSLKEAKENGYKEINDYEYGGIRLEIKGHVLGSELKEAKSKSFWKESGFQPKAEHVDNPHATRYYPIGKIHYGVFREDQVEPIPDWKATQKQALKDWSVSIGKQYGQPENAISDAAETLFNLNKFTRSNKCSLNRKSQILDLKSRFIKTLYDMEVYTDRVEELQRTLGEQRCFGDYDDYSVYGDMCCGGCERCENTGIYRKARVVSSFCFYFTVYERQYCWMVPDNKLGFKPRVEEVKKMKPNDGIKDVVDKIQNFRRDIALIEYACCTRKPYIVNQ